MAYDSLLPVSYFYPALNFATGSTAKLKIPRKAGMARVLDILVAGTVLFTQVTTPASVQIGDGSTPNVFGQLTIGALAANSTIGAGDAVNGLNGQIYLAGNYNSGAGLHDLIATFVAPTGGTPAGTANVIIVVGYDQIPQ